MFLQQRKVLKRLNRLADTSAERQERKQKQVDGEKQNRAECTTHKTFIFCHILIRSWHPSVSHLKLDPLFSCQDGFIRTKVRLLSVKQISFPLLSPSNKSSKVLLVTCAEKWKEMKRRWSEKRFYSSAKILEQISLEKKRKRRPENYFEIAFFGKLENKAKTEKMATKIYFVGHSFISIVTQQRMLLALSQ